MTTSLDRLDTALATIDQELGSIKEMIGNKGRVYNFPTYTVAKNLKLVYPDKWGYSHGRFSSLGERNQDKKRTDQADSYVIATHILRAGWYKDAAPDCDRKHTGAVCEGIRLLPVPSADPQVQHAWQKLQSRLTTVIAKVQGATLPLLESRKDAQAAHDTKRAAMQSKTVSVSAPPPSTPTGASAANSPPPMSSSPADPASNLDMPEPVDLELGDVLDPEFRIDEDVQLPPPTPTFLKLPEAKAFDVGEFLKGTKLGGDGDSRVLVDLTQETTATGIVTKLRISKGLSENEMVQLHRLQVVKTLAPAQGNPIVNTGSVAAAYKQLVGTGGGCRTVLAMLLTSEKAGKLTQVEFASLRNAFYNVVHQKDKVAAAIGPGWKFDKMREKNIDGSDGKVVVDDAGDEVYHAWQVTA